MVLLLCLVIYLLVGLVIFHVELASVWRDAFTNENFKKNIFKELGFTLIATAIGLALWPVVLILKRP